MHGEPPQAVLSCVSSIASRLSFLVRSRRRPHDLRRGLQEGVGGRDGKSRAPGRPEAWRLHVPHYPEHGGDRHAAAGLSTDDIMDLGGWKTTEMARRYDLKDLAALRARLEDARSARRAQVRRLRG